MEEKKPEFSSTIDSGVSPTVPKRSILRLNTSYGKDTTIKVFRKSQSLASNRGVTFPDKFKKPMHVIFEVEPIVYEETVPEVKKNKKKGCQCLII
jgi:hypothetical protein